jgi:hypothetical protein
MPIRHGLALPAVYTFRQVNRALHLGQIASA